MVNTSHVCALLFVIAQASLHCFSITFTSPSPKCFLEGSMQVHSKKFVSSLSRKLDVDKLAQGLDAAHPLASRPKEQLKIDLLLELARVYWERILLYQLARSGTGIEWTDLIQRANFTPDPVSRYAQEACLEAVERDLPLTVPSMATPVYRFIRDNGLPNPMKPLPLTINQVQRIVNTVRTLPFFPGCPNLNLARDLCDILDYHVAHNILPNYDMSHTLLSSRYSLQEMYKTVADCRADLPPVDLFERNRIAECRVKGQCRVIR